MVDAAVKRAVLAALVLMGGARAGAVTVSWDPVTTNSDGTAITNLAGYRLFRHTSSLLGMTTAQAMANSAIVKSTVAAPATSMQVPLTSGTYYFRLTAFNTDGIQSRFNLDASGGEVQASTTVVTSTVFNFSLANGGAKSVSQGASVTNSVTATLVSGTAQAVSLSVSGLPAGVTGSFSPISCSPSCSTTLTLSASASAAAGGATVTVTAAGGGVSRTSSFALTVNATGGGPSAHWKFDEASGAASAADASGNGNNATLTGGPVSTAGRFGAALNFDGVNDKASAAHSASLNPSSALSVSVWAKPTIATATWRALMVKNYTVFLYASIQSGYCGAGGVLGGVTTAAGTKTVCSAVPVAASTWTHLSMTYDGANLRLYKNGIQAAVTAATGTVTAGTGSFDIGASQFGEYFMGAIDDARVYNRALSAAEVLALFNAVPTGTVTDLNGDGATNVADVQIAVNQALGVAACSAGDVNKDGACNVADVQMVVNKAMGL